VVTTLSKAEDLHSVIAFGLGDVEYHPKSGMYIEKYSGRLVHPVGGENSFFFL
jgi:hypothetical protein